MKKLLVCVVLLSSLSASMAQNLIFANITQGNFTGVYPDLGISALTDFFLLTKGFIDIVFSPFSDLQAFITELIDASSNVDDFLQELLKEWEKLLSLEAGLVACWAIGALFLILVVIGGLVMCCCRTCCSKCGGEMKQSMKRKKSKWRHFLCLGLLVCDIFMAVPCVYIFLINEWTKDSLNIIPQRVTDTIDNLEEYVNLVPEQIDDIAGQYGILDASLRKDISDIGTTLGIPISEEFIAFSQPALNSLEMLSNDTKEALAALQNVQNQTNYLSSGMFDLNTALSNEKTSLETDLSSSMACIGACQDVLNQASVLDPTGADFSSTALPSVQREIDSLSNLLSTYDIDEAIAAILQEFDDIPEIITNSTEEGATQALETLTDVNETIWDAVNNLPTAEINDFTNTIKNLNSDIVDAINSYNDNYDLYRYIVFAVLGSYFAFIVFLYLMGMILGTASFSKDTSPHKRTCCSNCGGILIMSGVGLSFLFAWLLMILVALTFTVGGNGERYACQPLEPPYVGLQFTDDLLKTLNASTNYSIYDVISDCEQDDSIYNTLDLVTVVNMTEVQQNVTDLIAQVNENLANVSFNLSSIVVYTPEIQAFLDGLKNSGILDIDWSPYTTEIDKGLTTGNLIAYAEELNATAENFSASSADLADILFTHSYQIVQIQLNFVDPLQESLDSLNRSVNTLQHLATVFNDSVDATAVALQDLEETIQINGSIAITKATEAYANDLTGDVTEFSDWMFIQVTDNLGRCRPVFDVYTQSVSLACAYILDLLNCLWFSLGWGTIFLIPAAIFGMKLAKFYRRLNFFDEHPNINNQQQMEMWDHSPQKEYENAAFYADSPQPKYKPSKVHPSKYY